MKQARTIQEMIADGTLELTNESDDYIKGYEKGYEDGLNETFLKEAYK